MIRDVNYFKSNFKLNPCNKRFLELGIRKETAYSGHFYGRDEHSEYNINIY